MRKTQTRWTKDTTYTQDFTETMVQKNNTHTQTTKQIILHAFNDTNNDSQPHTLTHTRNNAHNKNHLNTQ